MADLALGHREPILVQQTGTVSWNRLSGTSWLDLAKTIGEKDMTDLCGAGAI